MSRSLLKTNWQQCLLTCLRVVVTGERWRQATSRTDSEWAERVHRKDPHPLPRPEGSVTIVIHRYHHSDVAMWFIEFRPQVQLDWARAMRIAICALPDQQLTSYITDDALEDRPLSVESIVADSKSGNTRVGSVSKALFKGIEE